MRQQQQEEQSKEELLFQLVSYNDIEGIKSLCHEGASLECVDEEGRTPLILSCTKLEPYDVAKTLLELGSNVNSYRSGCNGGTPLHHAAKSGLGNTVKLLLSHGANPLVPNDNLQTPLKVARASGYSNVVRAIESHICLFSGWMLESYGPSFLEPFAPQILTRRVWVVVVPTCSRNPTKPLKLELVLYDSLQDAQPRTLIDLWKSKLEQPKSYQSEASVMIVDNSTSPKLRRPRRNSSFVSQARRWVQVCSEISLKLASASKGDMQQLNLFCEACKGITQSMNPPMFMETTTDSASLQSSVNEKSMLNHHALLANPSRDGGVCVIDVDDASTEEAVCVPCGHVAGCVSCLKEIKDKNLGCPVCRANIDQVIKLYHV